MMKILLCIAFVLAAVILPSVRILLKKDGKFSSQHISQSKTMRERGIHCAVSQDREAKQTAANKMDVKSL
jgi:hypothetical protein